MELNYRILGNQPEPSLTQPGFEITDFEVRTKDVNIFEQGKYLIERYISDYPELEGTQLVIDDPMTVGLYPSYDENDNPSPYRFNSLVLKLEELGFYGKAADYVRVS